MTGIRNSKKKRICVRIMALGLLCGAFLCACARSERYQQINVDLFDTVTAVVAYGTDAEEFNRQAEAVFAELAEYDRLYDIYHDDPEYVSLKAVNDAAGVAPVAVDSRIMDLLSFGKEVYAQTGGKVNIGMGAVLSLWHEAREETLAHPEFPVIPSRKDLEEAAQHTDLSHMILDPEAGTVYLEDPEMRLDVGALAKGYAVQEVQKKLPAGFLISAGGNVVATGAKQGVRGDASWSVGIQDPEDPSQTVDSLSLTRGAVVTSGDYQRYFEVNGVRYHHIVDPDTLLPAVRPWHSVTVVCEDSAWADALSTAVFLMDREAGEALAASRNARIIYH